MPRKVKPEFTDAQAGMARIGLTYVLEGELSGTEVKCAQNALDELDRARREAAEGRDTRSQR